ncbi:hypothetical protein GNF18_06535 [Ligilactobacillus pobuzihii]|uniref:hypothetical protein n=1 Tax=Ligilactobacillus pobuzihii TaxID=449659 RepID=UPI0019D25837|nr:hypothetical protein [Ligilactobacillus pobuzihii]MBN7274788.1 hypothetical protein [Ligilactobacillus pobuzihii]
MKYIILLVGVLLLVLGGAFIYLAFSTNRKRNETIMDQVSWLEYFDLLVIVLEFLNWLGKKIHLKYLANVISFIVGLLLVGIGGFITFLMLKNIF